MDASDSPAGGDAPGLPGARIRLLGRAMSSTLMRAPFLWPLLRGPTRSFFDRAAPGGELRELQSSGYQAGLPAGL